MHTIHFDILYFFFIWLKYFFFFVILFLFSGLVWKYVNWFSNICGSSRFFVINFWFSNYHFRCTYFEIRCDLFNNSNCFYLFVSHFCLIISMLYKLHRKSICWSVVISFSVSNWNALVTSPELYLNTGFIHFISNECCFF